MKYIFLVWFVVLGFLSSCLPSTPTQDVIIQLQKDTAAIDNYLKQNNIVATKLSPGVWFMIDTATQGIRPTFNDSVVVTYKMKLLSNGSVVDQSTTPITFGLSNLIDGVQIAMPYFQKGSTGKIFIPSFYGYQNATTGAIPANSNLIFEFTLKEVIDQHLKTDTVLLDNYLKKNNIYPTVDPSGLRYTIDTMVVGTSPSISDLVLVNYSLSLLSPDLTTQTIQPYNATSLEYLLEDQAMAWKIALPHVPEGSFVTLYVPSSLGFGPASVSNNQVSQAYANLIYRIKLVKVIHH